MSSNESIKKIRNSKKSASSWLLILILSRIKYLLLTRFVQIYLTFLNTVFKSLSINQQLLYQIEANQIRMELLQEENEKLRTALGKMTPGPVSNSRGSSAARSAWSEAQIPIPSHGASDFQDLENEAIEQDDDLLDSPLPSDLRSLSQMSLASQQKWNTSNSARSNVSSGQRDNANQTRNPSCFLSFCRCGIRTRFF